MAKDKHTALGLKEEDLVEMFRVMLLARVCDERQWALNRQGKAPFVVPVSGHEAAQVGSAWAFERSKDVFCPYYRDLALVMACGFTPTDIFLGLFGKADDPCSGGRQMPAHWGCSRRNVITGSSPIATQLLHAAGIAYSKKYKREDAVVGTWFGEGATSEGDWHGALNFAGIHRLPIVFVCENNQYAISVPQSKQMAVKDVASRAEGYGFPGVVVDGNDVLACYGAMRTAHERARAGEGPTLIECKTYRFMPHTSDDDDKSYRSRDEVEQAKARDPLVQFASYLREHDLLDDAAHEALRAEIKEEIDEAIRAAWEAPDPDPDTALRHVFQEEER